MKNKWDNSYVALCSLILSTLIFILTVGFVEVEVPILISSFVGNSISIFLAWIYIRWVASTAEVAGRSYVGFMIVAILLSPIAWVIVLCFKKPEISPVSA